MKTNALACIHLFVLMAFCFAGYGQNEPFTFIELNQKPGGQGNYRLAHPFEILYGPDDYLYITEKPGRVLRVDTGTGVSRVILDHRTHVFLHITRNGSGTATGIGQDGMMGMALHPNFSLGTGQDSIFIAYSHASGNVRISRFKFNNSVTPSLTGETILISGIPSSNDHSTGRLITGADNKLYYSCGDMGNNQFGNRCSEIKAQSDPSSAEITVHDYSKYAGKILRLEFDGSVPQDNPLFNGVRSHIYTKGHRNPQGLVWEKSASSGFSSPALVSNGRLFSSEHGPRTDDELNLIEAGRNYGWPYIAGDSDNVNYEYINWSTSSSCAITPYTESAIPAGAVIKQESEAPAAVKNNFSKPLINMFPSCGTQTTVTCHAGGTNWMKFATIAPASVDYYHVNGGLGIPDWYPSLLIPTLRKGTLYRVKLNASRNAIVTDTIPYFTSFNRYRDIAISPDGQKIYIVTDSVGATSGPSGTGTNTLMNPGAILVFQYNQATLALTDHRIKRTDKNSVNIYPNPARDVLHVELMKSAHQPVHYSLFDVTGKKILTGYASRHTFTIPVTGLRRGVYIIRITDGYGLPVLMKKVILQ